MDPTTTKLDERFGDPAAEPTPWSTTSAALHDAELYWLSTVRDDGRPHVTPLIGLWDGDAFWFVTGVREQKARNLEAGPAVAVTTGTNTWATGLDIVVEGTAERVVDEDALTRIAEAFVAKYGEVWRFVPAGDGTYESGGGPGMLFRVPPTKAIAFAKDPHGHTTHRF